MGINYNPRTITDGLVLCLDAANSKSYPGSGTIWTDLSGNGNNGTLINGVGYSGDNLGSLVFDGVDDYGILTTNIFRTTLPNFSISVWYNNSTAGILLGNHFHNSTWESIWTSTTTFGVNGANNNTTNRQFLNFTATTFNTWNNLTFVNSSSLGYMKVFNNGDEIASRSANVVPWNSSIIPTIGAQRRNDGAIIGPITGNIPQVSIYNRALTPQEIQQNFNATKSRYI
jgi:hypothetical protein